MGIPVGGGLPLESGETSMLPMLQRMALHPYTYGQHELDLVRMLVSVKCQLVLS